LQSVTAKLRRNVKRRKALTNYVNKTSNKLWYKQGTDVLYQIVQSMTAQLGNNKLNQNFADIICKIRKRVYNGTKYRY